MPKVTLNGVTLAESDRTEVVEGNHYFPPESVAKEYLRESDTSTHCPWKGDSSYYSIEVDGASAEDAAERSSEQHPGSRRVLSEQGGDRRLVSRCSRWNWRRKGGEHDKR
jgi:uncharacterized protein (DUF427 family)